MGIFGNKKKIHPIDETEIKYVELIFKRLFLFFKHKNFLPGYPTIDPSDPIYSLKAPEEIVSRICSLINLSIGSFEIEIFDDYKSTEWSGLRPIGQYKEKEVFVEELKEDKSVHLKIAFPKSNIADTERMIGCLAESLSIRLLIKSNFKFYKSDKLGLISKATAMFFGFGLSVSNNTFIKDNRWITSSPVMLETVTFSLAFLVLARGDSPTGLEKFLNTDAKPNFKKSITYLSKFYDFDFFRNNIIKEKKELELFVKANELVAQNKFKEGVDVWEQLLTLNPGSSIYTNNIGFYKLRLGLWDESIVHLVYSLKLRDSAYAFNNLGFAYMMKSELEKAYENFQASRRLDPDNSFLYRNLGIYYMKLKKYDQAKINFDRAIELDPATELIHYFMGLFWEELNEMENAYVEFKKSVVANEPEGILKCKELQIG